MTNKNIDKAKGRVKEATGALTGDRHLSSGACGAEQGNASSRR